jgi:outer membrane protein assembly factor BamB
MLRYTQVIALALVATATAAGSERELSSSTDWPQWRGPWRAGVSSAKGLLKEWPAQGPTRIWSVTGLGAGYGQPSIQGARIFVQGKIGTSSSVSALNRADGKTIWTRAIGPGLDDDQGGGPRSTPTADGDRVYVLSENGDLACLKGADGAVVWQRNIFKDFGGRNPRWLASESPLVDGDAVIVTPGGPSAGMVSLDKLTGRTRWTSVDLSEEAAYSSVIAGDIDGVRILMTLTAQGGVGVRASDGKLMWRYPQVANVTANISTAVFSNNKVFFTSAYGAGAALLDLAWSPEEGVDAYERYFTREMQNHHGGVVLADGYLYGFNNAILTCLEFATGKKMWRHRSVGKGSITYADGHLYLLSEDRVAGLAEATPEGYTEKSRFTIEDEGWPTWSHPVVAGGQLFFRNQGRLTSYDVSAPAGRPARD